MNKNKLKISTATIVRLIVLILALVNQVLTATGRTIIDISDEIVYTAVSTAVTIVSALIAAWKNNSVTQAALEGDEIMQLAKERRKEDYVD